MTSCAECVHLVISAVGETVCDRDKLPRGGIYWSIHDPEETICTSWRARQ